MPAIEERQPQRYGDIQASYDAPDMGIKREPQHLTVT